MKIRRIQNTLIRAFAALIVFTLLLLGSLAYYYLRKILIQNAEGTTMQLVIQLNRVIENYISYMDDIALMAVNNEDVRAFMQNPSADSPRLRAKIGTSFEAIRSVRKDIDSVFLITRDGRAIAATPGGGLNPSVNLKDRFDELESKSALTGPPCPPRTWRTSWTLAIPGSFPSCATCVRLRGGPSFGLIQVDLNYEIIASLCRNIQLGISGYVFILEQQRGHRLPSPAAAHLRKPEVGADRRNPGAGRGQPEMPWWTEGPSSIPR